MPKPDTTRPVREIPLELPPHPGAWRAASLLVLAGTAVVVGLLFWRPEPTLGWLWNVVVPLLPASFLVTPALWRNVCPLATLNELPHRWTAVNRIPPAWWSSGLLAVIALALLVPARRALLNGSPEGTALAIAGLGLLALGGGGAFAARSGFCNSLCPILPVERLYGQHPLTRLSGSRCAACTFCTPRGCMDLARDKAMAQVLGRARHGPRWLLTPMGAFGAAFPGLILAYFTGSDLVGGLAVAPWARALGFGLASWAAVAAVATVARVRGSRGLTWLAAISFGLYYWFAAGGIAAEVGWDGMGRDAIRGAAGALLLWWGWRAWRRGRAGAPRSAQPGRAPGAGAG